MKIITYHRRVWKINENEVLLAIPTNKTKHVKYYEIESNYVGVIYSETDKEFKLYVGYKVNGEKTIPNIIGLAVKLGISSIKLEKCELIKHLKIWDHHVQVINKMLEATQEI